MCAGLHIDIERADTSAPRRSIDEIVALLPDPPLEIERQGEKIRERSTKVFERDRLTWAVTVDPCTYLDEEITALVDRVLVMLPLFNEHLPNFKGQLGIYLNTWGQHNPEIVIAAATMAKLVQLNARVWVDIYVFDDEDEDSDAPAS